MVVYLMNKVNPTYKSFLLCTKLPLISKLIVLYALL